MANPAFIDFLLAHCQGGVALAFSGGVDSTTLLASLANARAFQPFELCAFYLHTPLQPDNEAREAASIARQFKVEFQQITYDVLTVPQVASNDIRRCYYCKSALFTKLQELASERHLGVVMDGTHAEDSLVYRPGLQALREHNVFSPFQAFGMNKAQIRALASSYGLSCHDKPAAPCLATRFPYDTALSIEQLARVAQGEAFLRTLLPPNTPLRLRVPCPSTARIEVPIPLIPALAEQHTAITTTLSALGFKTVTLDLAGFSSGKQDRNLGLSATKASM